MVKVGERVDERVDVGGNDLLRVNGLVEENVREREEDDPEFEGYTGWDEGSEGRCLREVGEDSMEVDARFDVGGNGLSTVRVNRGG